MLDHGVENDATVKPGPELCNVFVVEASTPSRGFERRRRHSGDFMQWTKNIQPPPPPPLVPIAPAYILVGTDRLDTEYFRSRK